ncbi:MAG: glycosyltransferase family 2 protein [Phycisphaerales bacterium]|nr:glycosyltransferase family 2 protein [Phycisphaerae bacterium]NNF42464.1 glycosyltransferase family 2 protein [Phycisphaerales bacterium]NNM26077.1 glycosyltransferase family 2 protein [Phycisphaerales bacterium]
MSSLQLDRPPAPPRTNAAATLDVTIVIVSWNTCDLLRACLESVFAQTGTLAAEVVVVDNASHDGSADMVERAFPAVRLIRNDRNAGFAAANNQALRHARGRYVLLLNPDTVVLDDVISRTIAYADTHPDTGVVGCQVLQTEHEIQPTCFRYPSPLTLLLFGLGLHRLMPRLDHAAYGGWDRRSPRDVDVVSGMFMLVRHDAMNAVGLMDEDYFVYAEETDWCHRFRAHGWRCVFVPCGRILHVDGGGQSTRQVSVRMYVQMQKSLLLFLRKRRGRPAWATARALLIAAMLGRTAAWTLIGLAHPAGRHKRRQARAALRFLVTGTEPPA